MFDDDFRPHGFQTFQVLVDGARADGAAAGQADFCFAEAGKGRAEDEDRGAHGFYQLVRSASVIDRAAVDFKFGNIVG